MVFPAEVLGKVQEEDDILAFHVIRADLYQAQLLFPREGVEDPFLGISQMMPLREILYGIVAVNTTVIFEKVFGIHGHHVDEGVQLFDEPVSQQPVHNMCVLDLSFCRSVVHQWTSVVTERQGEGKLLQNLVQRVFGELAPELLGVPGAHLGRSALCHHIHVVLGQRIDDNTLTPVHEMRHDPENLRQRDVGIQAQRLEVLH